MWKSRITPFAAVGYTMLCKPDGFAVHNALSGTAGTRVALSSGASAALSYSYEQSASQTLADRQSIGLGLGVALGRKLQLGLQGEAALSRGPTKAPGHTGIETWLSCAKWTQVAIGLTAPKEHFEDALKDSLLL